MDLNTSSSVQQVLEQFTTEQLDAMLKTELEKEPVDELSVQMILRVLRKRDHGQHEEITPQMWELAQKQYNIYQRRQATASHPRKRMGWLLRGGSIAAVLAIVLLAAAPQQVSAGRLWDRLARWTADIVEFFGPRDNAARLTDYVFTTENPGLQKLYDTVVAMGITEPVVPMWLPEEAELFQISATDLPIGKKVHARFVCNESVIIYLAQLYESDTARQYHGNGSKTQVHTIDEVDYTVIQNNDNWVAIWSVDNVECSIVMDCQEDTLLRVLKSIYEMEEK